MVVMAAVYAQWVSVSGGLGDQQTYTEEAFAREAGVPAAAWRVTQPPATILADVPQPEMDSSQFDSGPQEPHYFPPTLYPMKENLQPTPTIERFEAKPLIAASVSGQLTEAEMRALLAEAGWEDALIPEALAVFCGINNRSGFPRGESGCNPGAVGDSGNSLGLAQLNGDTWAPYCGVPRSALMDALTNLQCARKVYQYDIDRVYGAWKQWTVKP